MEVADFGCVSIDELLPVAGDSVQYEIQGFWDGFKPVPRVTVSEWADEYRFLSSIAAAEAGRYRTDRTPYLRRIMDCLTAYEPYKKVVFMKGAQVGATEAGNNFIGYVMHISPAPMMMVQPTDTMIDRLSKTRIDPLIAACPELASRVAAPKSRDGKNTISMKTFPGGVLILTGANSATALRSQPVRYLILDEVDGYPGDVGDEGSPVELAIARTATFPNKKIFIISTPTVSGMSSVEREFEETDKHYYHVPCPHCGSKQKLEFANLHWDEGNPASVRYACIHCGALIEERHKFQMLEGGEWIPDNPEKSNNTTIGFHLNSLYSPYGWKSWETIVTEFLATKGSQTKLKVFVNTVLGETWAERGDAPPFKNLYNRREEYRLNDVHDDVCFLTAGVDVQRDRLELEIVGWCADKRSYSIDYRVLEGDTAGPAVWNLLADTLQERWLRSDNTELPIRMMAVDSGYNTTHVYEFCRRFDRSRVIPIKGQDNLGMAVSPPKQVDVTRSGKRVGHIRVWNVGVSFLKSELYSMLRLEKDSEGVPPPNYCHFPQYGEHYFRGLTAEEQVKKIVRGYPRYEWKKVYERNEPLDCRIYARAAAVVIGIDRLRPEAITKMGGFFKKASPTRAAQDDADRGRGSGKRKRRASFWD